MVNNLIIMFRYKKISNKIAISVIERINKEHAFNELNGCLKKIPKLSSKIELKALILPKRQY